MKYQLVLQWPTSSIDDYDTMISIEDFLIEELSDDSEVDGHDVGSGQMNIFILTDNPMKTFNEIFILLENGEHFHNVRVAYRHIGQDNYDVIWPKDVDKFEVL